jgi:hypothetical protein
VPGCSLAQLGEGIKECELVEWFVKEGDEVEEFGQVRAALRSALVLVCWVLVCDRARMVAFSGFSWGLMFYVIREGLAAHQAGLLASSDIDGLQAIAGSSWPFLCSCDLVGCCLVRPCIAGVPGAA